MSEGSHTAMPVDANWLDLVASSLPGILWSTDTALRIVSCQGTATLPSDGTPRDLCGMSLFELFQTENVGYPPIDAHRRALLGERSPVTFMLWDIPFRGLVAPIRFEDKTVGCVSLVFVLPSFESRCESIANTSLDLILFLRPDGTIEEVNRTRAGSRRERAIGKTIYEVTPRSEHGRLREAMKQVLQTGSMASLEIRFPRRFENPTWQTMRIGAIRTLGEISGLVLLATDVTKQRHALERLEAKERLLRDLIELQDRERRLVAYEIHDGLIQDVVGARMILQGIRQTLADVDPDLQRQVDTAVSLMARSIDEGRRLISELRPMIIDEMGLIDAIEYLIGEEESRDGTRIFLRHRIKIDRLSPLLQATVFRIVREAVTNARRHGCASRVDIRLTQIGGQFLIIEIQDDGDGFDPDRVPKDRYGLSGICERARLFGGGASIESSPESGTRITVKMALDTPNSSRQNEYPGWTWTI